MVMESNNNSMSLVADRSMRLIIRLVRFKKMEKIWCIRLLLLGLLCVAGFYSLLQLKRIWKECKCYIPDFLQEDPIYVFVACR